ncbi:hypothetical protein [Streptomyces phaeoluteigriseus]|uniref:hypothetical protein n=1 Tax=Streptomyces phaeoluteigriseus TaxID=114686 RepID=UPI0014750929|nr:hypothetical protein [Streptomyces phaeoluteigriseus]
MTTDEGFALMILIIAAYGWNATPVVEMKVPDASPDAGNEGQIIYRVELEKRRRRPADRYETRNLADWGANSPGRLITHAIESTAPAREMLKNVGAPTDRLIVWRLAQRRAAYGEGTAGLFDGHFHANVWRNWRQELGGEGSLNLRRLRKTVVITHQRQPTQHSQDTHDGAYVLPDPRTHAAAQPVITTGSRRRSRRPGRCSRPRSAGRTRTWTRTPRPPAAATTPTARSGNRGCLAGRRSCSARPARTP